MYSLGGSVGVLGFQFMTGNGMTLGLSLTYMAVISCALLYLLSLVGKQLKNSKVLAYVPVAVGLIVAGLIGTKLG